MSGIYPHDRSLTQRQLASIQPRGFTKTVVFGALDPRSSTGAQTAWKVGLVLAAALLSCTIIGAVYVKRAYRVYTKYQREVLRKIGTVAAGILPPGGGGAAAPRATSEVDLSEMTPKEVAAFERAKLDVERDAEEVSVSIKSYGIRNPAALIAIAKLAAQQDGLGVSEHIGNYGIVDPDQLFEIAKLAVSQDGRASKYIGNYGITDQDKLFEIAKLAVQENAWGVTHYIGKYGIIDQNVRIEIAKLAVLKDPKSVARDIKKYGIDNQAALIEIAKMAAQRDGLWVSCYISNYGIKNVYALAEIAWIAVAQNRESLSVLSLYGIADEKELCSLGIRILRDLFSAKGSEVKEGSDLFKALEALGKYRSLSIGVDFIPWCIDFLRKSTSEEVAAYVKAYEETPNLQVHFYLPCLILTQWGKGEGEDRATVLAFLRKQRDGLRYAATGHMQLLLRLLVDLSKEAISDATRWKLLARAIQEKDKAWSTLGVLSALCDKSTPPRVKAVADASLLSQGLSEGIKALLQARGVVGPESTIDDAFLKKYGETFGQTRVPQALLLYIKGIQRLADPSLMKAVQEFVQGVLTGTFRADRYNPERSPHLKKLAEEAPEVFAAWQKGAHVKKLGAAERPTEEIAVDLVAFFKQKMGDGHTKIDGEEQMPQLARLLSNEEALRQYQAQDDPTKIPAAVSSGGAAAEARISETEEICIQLLHPKTTPEQRKALLAALATKLDPRLELNNDIKALRKGPVRGMGELTVVNSDDWQDLFLCGTEVLGSCQRIDGDPQLNKCLLAYCLDGKNRLLAVKDASGKVLARCLFRLLWDEEKGKPVLFSDRIYFNSPSLQYEEALNDLALRIAAEMGCPLAAYYVDEGQVPLQLKSYGSPAPYEYEDAAGGVQIGGRFSVAKARFVVS